MMKVVLTGEKGKLGTRFCQYVQKEQMDIQITRLSLRNENWKNFDFTGYDAVIHCAGIVNSINNTYEEYEKINVLLTKLLFAKCVEQKVPHFVYLSSMAVYDGITRGFGEEGIITYNTQPVQKTYYGKSKYEAELAISNQKRGITKVSILRAPSIIGKDAEEYFVNYIRFSKIPLLPIPKAHMEAKRSIVYIDTLIEFIGMLLKEKKEGLFFPQNYPMLSVAQMYAEVCRAQGKYRISIPICCRLLPNVIEKRLFGQICYAEDLSYDENVKVGNITTYEAIKQIINGEEGND